MSSKNKLNIAKIDNIDVIYKKFYNNKDIFPHIRKDYIKK